jgi:hypothetical protein
MTDETVDRSTAQNADSDDPRLAVLQAVVDRLASWQDGADEPTVRKELDQAISESDVEIDESTRERIVAHLVENPTHGDVRDLLG